MPVTWVYPAAAERGRKRPRRIMHRIWIRRQNLRKKFSAGKLFGFDPGRISLKFLRSLLQGGPLKRGAPCSGQTLAMRGISHSMFLLAASECLPAEGRVIHCALCGVDVGLGDAHGAPKAGV